MSYSKEFLELLDSVTAKRPRTVIDHILKHGFITTEELKDQYGYNHPPRAVRDVREQGIPIETYRVEDSDGRKIAAYKFGAFDGHNIQKKSGRTVLSKKLKSELVKRYGSKCFIYNETMPEQELQIDHRVPFEVAGDPEGELNPDDFMLLSPSANREKDWSCEHCQNWQIEKNIEVCKKCYWAFPENYSHVAMKEVRRVDLEWEGDEIPWYEQLNELAKYVNKDIQTVIKDITKNYKK
ncbi:MAG: helix-turn-helix domain-containing protein [Treponema sp.]|nr:helix-turn-helix domain-containing protein [Treponema sp.]